MTAPFYADDLITLHLGSCLEELSWLDADVLITDPPYGLDYAGGSNGFAMSRGHRIAGDSDLTLRDDVLDLWGHDRFWLMFGSPKLARPDRWQQILIWDKTINMPGMGHVNAAFSYTHEEIALGGPTGWRRGERTRLGSVFRTPSTQLLSGGAGLVARVGHPTPKPVGMMEVLLTYTSGVVADPFAGSGSTLIAARNLGRRAIGVELDERYAEIAARRLAQLTLALV